MPIVLGANSASGGYNITNSLRFNSGSSDYLSRTPSTGSTTKSTFSAWVKRSGFSGGKNIFGFTSDGSNFTFLRFEDGEDWLQYYVYPNTGVYNKKTSARYRDTSAWYHIILAIDLSNSTNEDKVKIYVNGDRITSWSTNTSSNPTSGDWVSGTSSWKPYIGSGGSLGNYFDGYISDVYFIDGQQLTPSSFGETDTDTGIWIPKAYSGTYGTNGFYLQFKNSASLGTDSSGNGNNFTVNNLTSVDQTTDTPTNNFATMNPLRQPTGNPATLTNGNTTVTTQSTGYYGGRSTIGVSSGKWYFEAKLVSYSSQSGMIGIQDAESYTPEMFNSSSGAFAGYSSTGWSYSTDGNKTNNNSGSAYGNTYASGDIISVALDCDNAKLYFAKNGTWQNSGVPTSGSTGTGAISITSGLTYLFAVDDAGNTNNCVWDCNFGNPQYTGGSYTDGAGRGNFSYAVPSGYFALCTANLSLYG